MNVLMDAKLARYDDLANLVEELHEENMILRQAIRAFELSGLSGFSRRSLSNEMFGPRWARKETTVTPITKDAIQVAMAAAEEARAEDLRGMYPMACRVLAPTVQVLRDELAWVEAERDTLRAFAQDVMESWPHGDVDGLHLEELAVKHGVLRTEERTERCGENCDCAEFGFPATCHRRTALLMGPNV